jgi:poly(3-hydroxybutyrate) depolymerase
MGRWIQWGVAVVALGVAACEESSSSVESAGAGASTSAASSSASQGGSSSSSASGSGGQGGDGAGGMVGSPGCGTPETPGTSDETLDVGGTERSYVLALPEAVDGQTPVPLVFGFHGFNGSGTSASQYFELTGSEPAIYVYPQALPLPGQNDVGWDMEPDGVDVAFIDALLTALGDAHCIDLSRVFAAGHSHGASFSNHLGCYRPEALRAVAPVAGGGPWADHCTGSVSAMVIHGAADMDVLIENGMNSRDHWLDANGCSGASSSPADPSPCVSYAGCAEPVLWCEHGGGHEWPRFAGAGIRDFFLSF